MSQLAPTVAPMAVANGRWVTVLILTILLGWLGVHRFFVGKIGTGILWLLTAGLVGIGWLVDIILVLTRSFTDKSGQSIHRNGGQATKRSARDSSTSRQSLEFIEKGTEPETDEAGRVVVSLKTGSQIEIAVFGYEFRDEEATRKFFQPRKKGELYDEGEKTVRMRLVPELKDYWGGKCYRIETPGGVPAFEIRNHFEDDFALTQKILTEAETRLRALHPALRTAPLVYDIPIRINYQWEEEFDDEGEETGGVALQWDRPRIRLNDPLEIEVRAAQHKSR